MELKFGDKVTWKSQAGGKETRKQGEIVYILLRTENPYNSFPFIDDYQIMFDYPTRFRNHESYLVKVENGKKQPKLYWPLVKYLVKI